MLTRLTVRLPIALPRRLVRAARQLNRCWGAGVRVAIQGPLDEAARAPRPRAYQLAKDLLGSLTVGIPNLTSRPRERLLARFRRCGRHSVQPAGEA